MILVASWLLMALGLCNEVPKEPIKPRAAQKQTLMAAHKEPNMMDHRQTIVHLFEWKWDDIAEECERFLGPYGYGGVQVSPPNENAIIYEPGFNRNVKRPWWERYQPVSYKLTTRSGNEQQFASMVRRCNQARVRIYVDVVINHMTGSIGQGTGTGGSYYDTNSLKFDGVPYSSFDFNGCDRCSTSSCSIESYGDAHQVRNCRLSGLLDLNQSNDYVRGKIAQFLNHLIDLGVAGFRIDAAKHMWPGDLTEIFNRIKDLNQEYFQAGSKPFVYQEVIDTGSGEAVSNREYVGIGRVTVFKYGFQLGEVFRRRNPMKYLKNYGEQWGLVAGNDALVFIDNHDNQRGHGAGGLGTIITHFDSRLYKMVVAFMFAWPYGIPRLMSSYSWDRNFQDGHDINDWVGPPHDDQYNIKSVTINQDMTCGNGWVCEHRWRQIYNMVLFRNVAALEGVNDWWDNDNYQIAFSRGDKAFLAINNEGYPLRATIQTGLPPGDYCDIISGNLKNGRCTGRVITIGNDRKVTLDISNDWEDPMIALHVEAKVN
uniref:Alpha-amylase n=2 Tax=Lithobius maqinensis TaxID=2250572 RepID=D2YVN2_9MYRI|nr:alpha-amylase [Lithobius forficatus]